MAGNHNEIEKRLWDAADELRANLAFLERVIRENLARLGCDVRGESRQ